MELAPRLGRRLEGGGVVCGGAVASVVGDDFVLDERIV